MPAAKGLLFATTLSVWFAEFSSVHHHDVGHSVEDDDSTEKLLKRFNET